jgi:outer membrane receptor protein involved in Fe transport
MRRSIVALLALAIAAPAAHASGSADADEAEAQFRLGIRAFQQRDAQAAVAHFLASYRLAPNARVAYDLALAYDQLGQGTEAFRYLALLDSPGVPDELRATAAELRGAIEKKVAVLEIRTEPAGASVYVDRRDLGVRCVSPCVLALQEGPHTVSVERDGYEAPAPASRVFARGSRTVLAPALEQVKGALAFGGTTPGTTLRLEGSEAPICTALPCEVSLTPGPQVVIASAPFHGEARIPVVVRARERVAVAVALARLQGSLSVASHPQGQVSVDGRALGTGPLSITLPAGDHRVELRALGYATTVRDVRVAANETTSIDVDLAVREDVEAASRRVEEARLAPGSVTVITRSELEAFGYPTLTEALRGVRGLFVSDDSLTQATDTRGFAAAGGYCSGILVLLDDKPLNNPYYGGACTGIETITSLDDVERIEVIRGPSSALFGTSAFLATFQIVTRSGAAQRRLEARAATYGASVGRVGVRFDAPTAGGSLWGAVTTSGVTSPRAYFPEMREPSDAEAPATDARGARLDGWLENGSVARSTSGMLGYDSEALRLRIFVHRHARVLANAPYDVVVNDPRSQQTETRFSFDGRYAFTVGPGRASARAFGTFYDLDARYAYRAPIGLESEEFRGTGVGSELRWDGPLVGGQAAFGVEGRAQLRARLQTGNEFDGNRLNANDSAHYAGAFAQLAFEPLDRVRVTAGTRFDYDPRVPNASLWLFTSPRLAIVSERLRRGTTKLLFGKAFRAATTLERVYEASGWLANQTLEPEQIVNAELEHRQEFDAITLVGGVFGSRLQNLIVLTEVEPGTFQFLNGRDELTVYGVEGEVRVPLARAMQLSAQGSFAQRTSTAAEGETGVGIPNWMAGAKFIAPLSVAGASFAMRAALEGGRRLPSPLPWGATRTDPSARVDVVLGLPVPGIPADVKLGVYNLFDVLTATVPVGSLRQQTIPQEGRTLLLSLRLATDR